LLHRGREGVKEITHRTQGPSFLVFLEGNALLLTHIIPSLSPSEPASMPSKMGVKEKEGGSGWKGGRGEEDGNSSAELL